MTFSAVAFEPRENVGLAALFMKLQIAIAPFTQ
jgi:hypothetical protein